MTAAREIGYQAFLGGPDKTPSPKGEMEGISVGGIKVWMGSQAGGCSLPFRYDGINRGKLSEAGDVDRSITATANSIDGVTEPGNDT